MKQEQDLFGKTFDQQLSLTDGDIIRKNIEPNKRISAEIEFATKGSRVLVKAYDDAGNLLFSEDVQKKEEGIHEKKIKGEVVFEPLSTGVRVTARDENHNILWGYVASKETVSQIHCLVAIYDALQELIKNELEKRGSINDDNEDYMSVAQKNIDELKLSLENLESTIKVKKVSKATIARAKNIAQVVKDANRLICIETRGI